MSGQPGQLMAIGTVAAYNIAQALNLDLAADKVKVIENAIKDEIGALSTHFTLAFADISTTNEIEQKRLKAEYDAAVAELKSTWTFVRGEPVFVAAVSLMLFGAGVLLGLFVR